MIGLSLATVRVISHKGYLAYEALGPTNTLLQPAASPLTQDPSQQSRHPYGLFGHSLAKFQKPGCFRAYHPIYQVISFRLLLSFRSSIPPCHSVKLVCLRLPHMCLVHICVSSRLPLGLVFLHLIGFVFFIVVITAAFITTSGFVCLSLVCL